METFEPNAPAAAWNDFNKVIALIAALLGILVAGITVAVAVVGALYGYFTLQRDTADNKAGIVANQLQQKSDNAGLAKQFTDAQEKQGREFGEFATALKTRLDQDEKAVHDIDRDGTDYGRGKVDVRMGEIAAVSTRVEKIEAAFDEIAPKVARIDDHVEQMWGDYNARPIPAAPHINPKRFPKN